MNAIPNSNIASLTWKIDNISTLTREPINSPPFSSRTNEKISFHLRLHPKATLNYSDNVSRKIMVLLLVRENKTIPISAEYRISLVNSKVKQIKIETDLLSCLNRGCIFRRNKVLKPERGLTENGALTIYCEVKMTNDKTSRYIECGNSIARDYGSLLESSKLTDVVLVVGGHELKAHKLILSARSKVFAAMFEHDCDEKRTNRVDITDVEKEVFDELLRFIYTGKVESLDQNAADLLAAADKYQVDQLKSICSHYLTTHLTPESVAPTLVLADMHHVTELKEKCIEYINKQKGGIKLADWKKICESNLELAHLLFQRK